MKVSFSQDQGPQVKTLVGDFGLVSNDANPLRIIWMNLQK